MPLAMSVNPLFLHVTDNQEIVLDVIKCSLNIVNVFLLCFFFVSADLPEMNLLLSSETVGVSMLKLITTR